jgi:hypothetical protein
VLSRMETAPIELLALLHLPDIESRAHLVLTHIPFICCVARSVWHGRVLSKGKM